MQSLLWCSRSQCALRGGGGVSGSANTSKHCALLSRLHVDFEVAAPGCLDRFLCSREVNAEDDLPTPSLQQLMGHMNGSVVFSENVNKLTVAAHPVLYARPSTAPDPVLQSLRSLTASRVVLNQRAQNVRERRTNSCNPE